MLPRKLDCSGLWGLGQVAFDISTSLAKHITRKAQGDNENYVHISAVIISP
jgi:hypothetical protein